MREEMNAAASADDEPQQDAPVDRLPSEEDEYRHIIILELPCPYTETKDDGSEPAEKVKWTWHVIAIPESLRATYDATNEAFNDAMEAVSNEPKEVKIQTVKENQKLSVKKRGEALTPGLYMKIDDENEQLLAKVIESGEGKLTDEMRQALDDKYPQDNTPSNDNKKEKNTEQENGLETGGQAPDGIASP